jgi:uncharacterized protein involved in exopolysaccharide biosynthesis
MFRANRKIISFRLIFSLTSLLLFFYGCGSEKQEQTTKHRSPEVTEQEQKILAAKINTFENERKLLLEKMDSYHQTIQKLAQEYGTVDLSSRLDMKKQRVAGLLDELTGVEAERIMLEARIKMLEQKETRTAEEEKMLADSKFELQTTKEYEKRMREMLNKEDDESIELGRKQQTINEFQGKLELTKEMYNTVCRRIMELESTQQDQDI